MPIKTNSRNSVIIRVPAARHDQKLFFDKKMLLLDRQNVDRFND